MQQQHELQQQHQQQQQQQQESGLKGIDEGGKIGTFSATGWGAPPPTNPGGWGGGPGGGNKPPGAGNAGNNNGSSPFNVAANFLTLIISAFKCWLGCDCSPCIPFFFF